MVSRANLKIFLLGFSAKWLIFPRVKTFRIRSSHLRLLVFLQKYLEMCDICFGGGAHVRRCFAMKCSYTSPTSILSFLRLQSG
ncbi:unnamed protein product [Cuscuta campestris]|uniref:Uncharacterized protein n=1 Tax=Cuscuta campestris TaxID=132261 RepID=A0A484LTB7_9ASTE|nr:unnamed protein product [Cuscuta campestris]